MAVKVQILNIDLSNIKGVDSSFSAKLGNTFIVSENGQAFMNFGDYRPGNSDGTGLLGNGTQYVEPGSYQAGVEQVQGNSFKIWLRTGSGRPHSLCTTRTGGQVRPNLPIAHSDRLVGVSVCRPRGSTQKQDKQDGFQFHRVHPSGLRA